MQDYQPRIARSVDYVRGDVEPDLAQPGDWLARLEERGYLSTVLLRDIDAMSMAHSLEVCAGDDLVWRRVWTPAMLEGRATEVLDAAA